MVARMVRSHQPGGTTQGRTEWVGGRSGAPQGWRALLEAAIAMVGALVTVHPTNTLLVALHQVLPQLAMALPPVVTARGTLLAALSEPPRMGLATRLDDRAGSGRAAGPVVHFLAEGGGRVDLRLTSWASTTLRTAGGNTMWLRGLRDGGPGEDLWDTSLQAGLKRSCCGSVWCSLDTLRGAQLRIQAFGISSADA